MDDDAAPLKTANPFGRTLLKMIAHHEGAIAMAREHLATGTDETLRRFSQVLVATQSAEIDAMRAAGTSIAGP